MGKTGAGSILLQTAGSSRLSSPKEEQLEYLFSTELLLSGEALI